MRHIILMIVGLTTACADGRSVSGDLSDGFPTVDSVRVVGQASGTRVENGRFTLDDLPDSTASIRFTRGRDTVAVLELARLPDGRVRLHGLRRDPVSGRVFPTQVDGPGDDPIEVNGVRFAGDQASSGEGIVLAAAENGTALLLRTASGGADLRVVVDSTTTVRNVAGDTVAGWTAAAGDSLRVRGRSRGRYLFADRITLSRAGRDVDPPDVPSDEADSGADAEPVRSEATGQAVPTVVQSREVPRGAPGKGRGRGKGKGRRH